MNEQLRNAFAGMITAPALFSPDYYGFTRTLPDDDDPTLFTRVIYVRRDGSKIVQSDLSNKVDGKYLTETVKYFETDGVTIRETVVWSLEYEGEVIKSRIAA